MTTIERDIAVEALECLDDELNPEQFATTVVAGDSGVPYLDVTTRNPQLSETIYAKDGWYWWSWDERLSPFDDLSTAAAKITAVLCGTVAARDQR